MGRLCPIEWQRIGAPEHILEWVKFGVKVPFKDPPPPCFYDNHVKGATQWNFVDNEIQKLLREGFVCKVKQQPQCVLPIQTVPRKSGKLRLVIDCRYVNRHIEAPKFKQEWIEAVANQILEGDELISVDLENGFHHVDLHPDHWSYFGMCWHGQFYVWCVLPFGCSASPYIFKKILEPVTIFLRKEFALRIALFVDDLFQMSRKCCATDNRDTLINTLEDLGWKINKDKSQLVPSQQCSFIGFDVCSVGNSGPWIKVLSVKVKKLKSYIRRVLNGDYIQARMLAKVAGQCVAMT